MILLAEEAEHSLEGGSLVLNAKHLVVMWAFIAMGVSIAVTLAVLLVGALLARQAMVLMAQLAQPVSLGLQAQASAPPNPPQQAVFGAAPRM